MISGTGAVERERVCVCVGVWVCEGAGGREGG